MTGLICCTIECNLACKYCYEGNGDKMCMPDIKEVNKKFKNGSEKIIKFIDELYAYNGGSLTTIIWHGGEPLLISPENFAFIMQNQREKGHKIKWGLQTNGTLLTDEYLKVFEEYGVNLGVSVDGLKKHHDVNRITKAGKPTYDIIMKNLENVKNYKVGCGTLLTVTDKNVYDLEEIYDYFASKNIRFSFNALFPTNYEKNDNTLCQESFAEAICRLFDHWIGDDKYDISIQHFEQIIEGLFKPERGIPGCHWVENCSRSFVAMDTEGYLYPCEHWVGNEEFCFGNIDDGLERALEHNIYFSNRKEELETGDCRDCEIFELCYGGCPWSALQESGSCLKKDQSICKQRKILIRYIYDYIKPNYSKNEMGFAYKYEEE